MSLVKRHVVIGTAGHIDHGKSALVQALTGTDPDRLKEEKARGITIDLGFAHYESGGVDFAFVDVPGHERFVKNMLAGASGIDYVVLVIAADESVMPQTREHFDICRLLHIGDGLIALTKSDLVDEDTLELVRLEALDLVAGSFLQDAPIVPLSARTGAGLDALRAVLDNFARRPSARRRGGPVRLPIDRVFSIKGFGTVVTGTLVSGSISADQELLALPAGRRVKVRSLQVHGRQAAQVEAGQRTALNLGGVDVADLSRGETLVTAGTFEPTRRFDALIEALPTARPIAHGARVRFHHGTRELLGRVALAALVEREDDDPPSELQPGGRAYVRIRLEAPAVLTRADRFVLRACSPAITIAGGEVLDPQPPRGGLRTAAARRRFQRLHREDAWTDEAIAGAVTAFLDERGAAGLPIDALVTRAGVPPESVEGLVHRLTSANAAERAGDGLVAPAVLGDIREQLRTALRDYHKQHPLSDGLPREEARERLGRRNPAVLERAIEDLTTAKEIVGRDRLALASHKLTLSSEEMRARDAIEGVFRDAGLRPPDLATLKEMTRLDAAVVDRMVMLLVRQRTLIKIGDLLFHADALQRLKEEVTALKAGGGSATVDVGAFKARYGVTRKFAIPLLEYLDRERITRRAGDVRIVI